MVIYAKDTYQLPQKYINNNKAVLTAIRGESEERKMFRLRVQYLDGQVNDVVADNNTLVLLEAMMRYGIIARLTCKLR